MKCVQCQQPAAPSSALCVACAAEAGTGPRFAQPSSDPDADLPPESRAQQDQVELPPAGSVGYRFVAYILDVALVRTLAFTITIPLAMNFPTAGSLDGSLIMSTMVSVAQGLVIVLAIAAFLEIGYFTLLESSRLQSTVGKFLVGVRTVDSFSGERLTPGLAFVRAVIKALPSLVLALGCGLAVFGLSLGMASGGSLIMLGGVVSGGGPLLILLFLFVSTMGGLNRRGFHDALAGSAVVRHREVPIWWVILLFIVASSAQVGSIKRNEERSPQFNPRESSPAFRVEEYSPPRQEVPQVPSTPLAPSDRWFVRGDGSRILLGEPMAVIDPSGECLEVAFPAEGQGLQREDLVSRSSLALIEPRPPVVIRFQYQGRAESCGTVDLRAYHIGLYASDVAPVVFSRAGGVGLRDEVVAISCTPNHPESPVRGFVKGSGTVRGVVSAWELPFGVPLYRSQSLRCAAALPDR